MQCEQVRHLKWLDVMAMHSQDTVEENHFEQDLNILVFDET